ncbi:sensor histidine kinase KdpD [cf. Phormidesmis sp. LEGE 11477]|uniref:sensor histidine kinase n=1 Tax=cf. Phormidesmis sp. LEGE 11477 TaxID=1828680 RepID=UPI001880B6E2|nr:HAMP domain-containing sensor histidine kinase [cf. Phormidesmis sp. LEGE 11477]MBE9061324.1 HAMP domain-containing histidine kinase [cf. Phormidesmis sp. LEGE 11477]
MGAPDQLLPTISALVALGEFAQDAQNGDVANIPTLSEGLAAEARQQRAKHEWTGAIAALTQLLNQRTQVASSRTSSHRKKRPKQQAQALLLTGPVPLLSDPGLISQISSWTFVPHASEELSAFNALSPVERIFKKTFQKQAHATRLLPLLEDDPLVQEQFALVLTEQFSLVLVLGEDADSELSFQFSFMPEVVSSVWRLLRSRILLTRPQQLDFIEALVEKFEPKAPSYRIVSQFNRWMLACLPSTYSSQTHSSHSQSHDQQSDAASDLSDSSQTGNSQSNLRSNSHSKFENSSHSPSQNLGSSHQNASAKAAETPSDSAFLQAMAHEIRTPLTTIRTYTRSLLKRKDLSPQVVKRLKSIDRECTQQIDRFSLIFKAVELEAASQSLKSPLSAIALSQVFQDAIPQWQQAAQRRNLSLEVGLPPDLPMVASDPTMLQHVLTGLVELFTHSVSQGSHIQLNVLHAGDQLKLQFQSQGDPNRPDSQSCTAPPLQSLGHLLMFQPDTGGLSLNLEATKNLFHALGAKLTVRERSDQSMTWTVFLPLETSGLQSYRIV